MRAGLAFTPDVVLEVSMSLSRTPLARMRVLVSITAAALGIAGLPVTASAAPAMEMDVKSAAASAPGAANSLTAGAALRALTVGVTKTRDVTEEPDAASAMQTARTSGHRVEDLSKRTESAQTFANPDGTMTLKSFATPVRVKQADGSWADVDFNLVRRQDGSYAPKVAATKTYIGGGGSMTAAKVVLEDGSSLAVSWPETLPAPRVQGGVATYKLSEDMDLLAIVVAGGVAVHIRLNKRPTAAERALVLGLHSNGLRVAESPTGGLQLTDKSGKSVAGASTLVAWDARVDEAGDPMRVVPLSVDLDRVSGAGLQQSQDLSLTTPDGFLDDPSTVYPVTIDPDITSNAGRVRDTYVRYGDTTSNGSIHGLDVGRSAENANSARAYIQFDTSSLSGKEIESASLGLWQYHANQCADRNMLVQPVATSWVDAITWSNKPNVIYGRSDDSTLTEMKGQTGSCDAGWTNVDVKSMVDAWTSGTYPNYGVRLALSSSNESNLSYERRFCSMNPNSSLTYCRSTSTVPYLSVTYWQDPPSGIMGAGDRKFYKYVSEKLTDKLSAKVNVGNGNLLVTAHDAKVSGIAGLDLKVDRYYNSNSAATPGSDVSGMGAGWSTSLGGSVRLEFPNGNDSRVYFFGPSGYRVQFDKNGSSYDRTEPGFDGKLTYDNDTNTLRIKMHDKTVYVFQPYSKYHRVRGHLTQMRDKNGNHIDYAYNADGTLDHATDTRGRKAVMGYSSDNLTTMEIRKADSTVLVRYRYAYASGRLTSSKVDYVNTSALPDTSDSVNVDALTTYSYDANGRLAQIKDARENSSSNHTDGGTTTINYDSSGNVWHLNRLTEDSSLPVSTSTFAYATTVTGTDCAGNGDGATARTVVNGERTDVTDTTTYCLDQYARVQRVIDAKGHHRKTTWTANSNVATFDGSGLSSGGSSFTMTYDGNDNATNVETPSGGKSSADYADSTNPNFPTAMRDFDTGGEGADNTWEYDYDDDGNLIDATASMKGDAAKKITYRYCWDANGQLQRIDPIDAIGNNLAKDTDLNAGCGTANQGNDTLFTYDSGGNLTTVDPPGPHGTQTYTYDALSRVRTVTDGRGVVTTYSYDTLDHVTEEVFDASDASPAPDGPTSRTVQWTFDPDGNLTHLQDPTGTETYGYDELNRRTTQSRGGLSPTKTYAYDLANNLLSYQVAGEPDATKYTYDVMNLVLSVDDPRTNTDQITFDNDRHDKRIKTVFPMSGGNDLVQRVKYDDGGLIKCVYSYRVNNSPVDQNDVDPACPDATTDGLITYRKYNYDTSVSGITIHTNTRYKMTEKGGVDTKYDYDPISRLTDATTTMGTGTGSQLREFDYKYDRHSNLVKDQTSGGTPGLATGTTYFGYDVQEELCWIASTESSACTSPPTGATTYSYDGAGALTAASNGLALDYNTIGQTSGIDPTGGGTTPIPMDYTGVTQDRRTSKDNTDMSYGFSGLTAQTSSGQTDWFIRDPDGNLLAMVDSAATNPGPVKYYLTDAQQSVIATMDTGGATRRYLYESYGQQIRSWLDPTPAVNVGSGHTPPDGSERTLTSADTENDSNPWRYASGYYDNETGMLKFGARYYMPNLSRWTQIDPKPGKPQQPITMNPYLYAGCNPVDRTDPRGRDWDDFLEGASKVASVVGGCYAGAQLALTASAAVLPFAYLGGPVVGAVAPTAVGVLGCATGSVLGFLGGDAAIDIPTGN